jgi:SAM-dependent methyltransferase
MNMVDSQTEQTQSITIKRAQEHYLDRWLGLYEYDEYKKWLFRKVLIPIIKKYVPKGIVLEIGCSKGYLLKELEEHGYEAIGIDISSSALKYSHSSDYGHSLNTIRADGENSPITKESAHAVLAINTLEHLPTPEAAIQSSQRVLKPRGLFLAITPNEDSTLAKIAKKIVPYTALKNPYHVSLMNKGILIDYIKQAGFRYAKVTPFHNGFFGSPLLKNFGGFIPLSYKVSAPYLHHLIVVAIK